MGLGESKVNAPGARQDPRSFVYRIDAEEKIVYANEHWYAFATENGATGLAEDQVLGRSLWGFIADASTSSILRAVVQKVRRTGVPAMLPYRCDSPTQRREMEVRIHLLPTGEVEFASNLLHSESREPVGLWNTGSPSNDEHLLACGWCKRVQLSKNTWVEAEEAVRALNLFLAPRMPPISHGLCSDCQILLQTQLEKPSRA